jgi:hypothetical protein
MRRFPPSSCVVRSSQTFKFILKKSRGIICGGNNLNKRANYKVHAAKVWPFVGSERAPLYSRGFMCEGLK